MHVKDASQVVIDNLDVVSGAISHALSMRCVRGSQDAPRNGLGRAKIVIRALSWSSL